MSEPTWTAKMFDENKALKAELKTVIYKHAEAEHTIIKLRAEIEKLTKLNAVLAAELSIEIAYHAGTDTHYRARRMRDALKNTGGVGRRVIISGKRESDE